MYSACCYLNTDKDFQEIRAFLIDLERFEHHDNNWDPGRFEWWRYSYHHDKDENFFKANSRYWRDASDKIVGLAISEYGKNDIFFIAHPEHKGLYHEMIQWGIESFGQGKSMIKTPMFENEPDKIEIIKSYGFERKKHDNNVRLYDMKDYDFSYDLKQGFRIVIFDDFRDFEKKSELICSAFSKPSHPVERIHSFLKTPGYNPDLDLLILNEADYPVAYCTGWQVAYDMTHGCIEPMGVHEDYRRMGFGSVLAKEAFRRLHTLGVKTVEIASHAEPDISNHLYESLNPASKKSGYDYELIL